MKKVLALSLGVLMLFAFAACSTSNQADDTAADDVADAPAEDVADDTAADDDAADDDMADDDMADDDMADDEDEWVELDKLLQAKRFMPEKTGMEPAPTTKETIKIGFMPTAMNTHYDIVIAGAQEQAASYGDGVVEIVIQAPSGQSANVEQISICEAWIQQGFDAICIAVSNDEMMTPTFKAATEAGIPVFLFNTPLLLTSNPYYVANVGYCQYEGGYTFGKYLAENFAGEELNIALMRGLPGTHDSERMEGFFDASGAVSEANPDSTTNGRNPNFKVVSEATGDWARSPAQIAMDAVLQAHSEIDILFADYDEMALGALVSIKAADRLSEIKIYGYDNTPDAMSSMENGEMFGTTDTVPKLMGVETIKTAVDFCMNGIEPTKAVYQECFVWDLDNMDQFDTNNYIWVK